MSRRRGQARSTRSSSEPDEPWFGKTQYHCSGRGSHVPICNLDRVEGGLRCPLCGCSKPVGYKTRKRIREARLTEVDISALPF